MGKRRMTVSAGVLMFTCLVIMAIGTLAMASPSYRLDWFVPLSGGGVRMASASYVADVTIGQTAVGGGASANYKMELGYWAGVPAK